MDIWRARRNARYDGGRPEGVTASIIRHGLGAEGISRLSPNMMLVHTKSTILSRDSVQPLQHSPSTRSSRHAYGFDFVYHANFGLIASSH